MKIEHISIDDMPRSNPRHREHTDATRALLPGQAFKTLCIWPHREINGACGGSASVRKAAKDAGFEVITRCKDGVLYVGRLA